VLHTFSDKVVNCSYVLAGKSSPI